MLRSISRTRGICATYITVIFRVRVGLWLGLGIGLGFRLGLGFSSGQSQCVPPFRSGNYTNPMESDQYKGKRVLCRDTWRIKAVWHYPTLAPGGGY